MPAADEATHPLPDELEGQLLIETHYVDLRVAILDPRLQHSMKVGLDAAEHFGVLSQHAKNLRIRILTHLSEELGEELRGGSQTSPREWGTEEGYATGAVDDLAVVWIGA